LLAAKLEALGAEVLLAPTIRIEPPENPAPLDDAIHASKSGKYDWIVFTSVNAVEAFFGRAAEAPNAHYAAIGPATAEALETRGLNADIVPGRHVAEDVFEALRRHTDLFGKRFLLPQADIAREALPRMLREAGTEVDVVSAYRTVPDAEGAARANELVRTGATDAVTFTSASTVRGFLSSADEAVRARLTPASIGPITSAALRDAGVEPATEAKRYTAEGLVEALVEYFEDRGSFENGGRGDP